MRLTLHTDYALRMLTLLAIKGEELTTISEVAEKYDISKNHLMKIAQTLVHEEIVEATRGRGGGLRLALEAHEVSIGRVVRKLEQSSVLVECFQGGAGTCVITPACKLKGILAEAQEAFFQVLDKYSLADLTKRNPDLRLLLGAVA